MTRTDVMRVIKEFSDYGAKCADDGPHNYRYHVEETTDGVLLVVPEWQIDKDHDFYPPRVCLVLEPDVIEELHMGKSLMTKGLLLIKYKDDDQWYGMHPLEPILGEVREQWIT